MAATKPTKKDDSPEGQLDTFIDKFTPAVATLARACLEKMRARLPGAVQMVYDNYKPGDGLARTRASEAIFSMRSTRDGSPFFLQVAIAGPKATFER